MVSKIGVVGGGVVGKATARAFMEHAEVRVYDTVKERATHDLYDVLECDLVFVCLPTPMLEDGRCDVSHLDNFFDFKLGSANREHKVRQTNFVLRSTVPIGTTRRLAKDHCLPNIVHSPEFLTARCANTDAQLPSRNIIGRVIEYGNPKPVLDPSSCLNQLLGLYNRRFSGIQTHMMTSDESEAVKLILNGFFAVKVAYFNEVNSMCEKLGLNWSTVMDGVMSDGRIAHSHTKVPGPDGKYGFGGECLPKDLSNLMHCIKDSGEQPTMSEGAAIRNLRDRNR